MINLQLFVKIVKLLTNLWVRPSSPVHLQFFTFLSFGGFCCPPSSAELIMCLLRASFCIRMHLPNRVELLSGTSKIGASREFYCEKENIWSGRIVGVLEISSLLGLGSSSKQKLVAIPPSKCLKWLVHLHIFFFFSKVNKLANSQGPSISLRIWQVANLLPELGIIDCLIKNYSFYSIF